MTDGIYLHIANGFDSATGISSGQAGDEAVVRDSDQPDSLTVEPGSVLLTGGEFEIAAVGFPNTSSISDVGAGDTATVFDSSADDRLMGSLSSEGMSVWRMVGGNYNQYLRGFEATIVNAINGGTDELTLTDSPVDDLLQLSPMFMELTGRGATITANGFADQVITSGGGNDSVQFLDSTGDDQFNSGPLVSVMQGNNYLNRTIGYSNVRAVASQSGQDEITILGSDGPDQILLSGSGGSYSGQTISRKFERFDRAIVFYDSGNDDLQVKDIDYELKLIDQSICGTALIGDANLDGVFNSSDLVQVFEVGEYEDNIVGNSTFQDGDWNCDGEFDSNDLVLAFQAGHYVADARPSSSLVAAAVDGLFGREEDNRTVQPFGA